MEDEYVMIDVNKNGEWQEAWETVLVIDEHDHMNVYYDRENEGCKGPHWEKFLGRLSEEEKEFIQNKLLKSKYYPRDEDSYKELLNELSDHAVNHIEQN